MFPPIGRLNVNDYPSGSTTFIGAAGFETRALSLLEHFIDNKIIFRSAIVVKYIHGDPGNKFEEFQTRILKNTAPEFVSWIEYDTRDPQSFQDSFRALLANIETGSIIVDTSGMSKLLIMIVLQSLRGFNGTITISYSEAEKYYPTEEEFEQVKKTAIAPMDFLKSDIFRILHVTSLSTASMQGYPILLIVYPTFNEMEILALQNGLTPNCIVFILGKPHEEKNYWRLDAVKEINNKVLNNSDFFSDTITLSTFDYISNIHKLESIYKEYKYTHRVILAPTGSKLQTIADYMFKQIHPDVQIVYPVTESFKGEYTKGCKTFWSIKINSFSTFISMIERLRFYEK